MQRRFLRAVIRIDVDVVFGEVARPEGRAALSLAYDPEDYRDIGVVETEFHVGFIEGCSQTVAANLDILESDFNQRRIEIDSGVTSCRKNTAPVRVGTGDGRFHE